MRALAAAGLLLLTCAAAQAQDALALVIDSVALSDAGTGAFFVVDKVDGQAVETDALSKTQRASRGKGGFFTVLGAERTVPAGRPIKLALRGQIDKAGPPIITMFSLGSMHVVKGEVEVELKAGARYRVTGWIDNFRRELWLEDVGTGEVVAGTRVASRADTPEDRKAMEGALYTCCNLHYEGDWISDANWTTLPLVPAGSRIKLVELERKSARVLIEGRKLRIGVEYGNKLLTHEKLVSMLMVKDDPAPRIAAMAPAVQAAIRAGKVSLGMTREEVTVALGPPRVDLTPSPDAAAWAYHTYKEELFTVRFGADGRVTEVAADAAVVRQVVHAP